MDDSLNVLILSAGTRNKIVDYFKREIGSRGTVAVTDCSELAPALYAGDRHFVVPRIGAKDYLETLLGICRQCQAKLILSLIDPELSVLARHQQDFQKIGTVPLISDYATVEMCLDKYLMLQFLQNNGFNVVRNYVDKDRFFRNQEAGIVSYPVMVKPRRGSASLNISKAQCREQVELCFKLHEDLLIEEFIPGQEYGVDAYVDMVSGEPVAIFAKEKIRMRAGETDKSRSVKDEKLFELVEAFLRRANLRGVIDIDLLKSGEKFFITDVNPRFGGGYPHAHECGVNFVKLILNNVMGQINDSRIGDYKEDIFMMKYSEILMKGEP